MMYLRLGEYSFEINSTGSRMRSNVVETRNGIPYLLEVQWDIDGRLRNRTGVSRLLDAKIVEMERAASKRGIDVGLYHDDGRRTSHYILNSNTLGGVRLASAAYPEFKGGEYCTFRSFQLSYKATVPFTPTRIGFVEFDEQLQISGGGQRFGVTEKNRGIGRRQQLRTHSKCVAQQSGRVVGMYEYPQIPGPVWPFALVDTEPDVSLQDPETRGSILDGTFVKYNFPLTYTWRFEWPVRLNGRPNFALG